MVRPNQRLVFTAYTVEREGEGASCSDGFIYNKLVHNNIHGCGYKLTYTHMEV